MIPSKKRLLEFVKEHHEGQKRKYTGEEYFFHVLEVANGSESRVFLGWEVGLCHDLIEDTDCTYTELYEFLVTKYKCSRPYAQYIVEGVRALTDVYTKEAYPELNRKDRKILEAKRLGNIDKDFQTIKYVDLIDNTASILEHDPKFSKVYLEEKK